MKQVTFNYSSMMSKTAVQKDRFSSQFEGAATSFGGLSPPSPSLVTSLHRVACRQFLADPIIIIIITIYLFICIR